MGSEQSEEQQEQAGAGQERGKPNGQESGKALPPDLKDEIVSGEHTLTVDGRTIPYIATAGRIVLRTEEGKPQAAIFFVAYTRSGVDDPARRPITFSFNGGPGSSSVWLHLGLLGPRRVLSGDVGDPQPPPYRLVDNAYSLLDVTDLVFIDPVSTGYSRAAEAEKAKQFHGVEQDVESVADFIRLYTTRYQRWLSPKFLAGESYGTTRAAGLAGHLQEKHGMYLNGLLLISTVLDFQTVHFEVGNDLPYMLFLPTYTATAWRHGRLPPDLQAALPRALAEAEAFAAGDYALALLRGDALQGEERAAIAARLARLTGLSQGYVERTNLRVEIFRFTKELLREQRRTVGRLDSRFTGIDRDAAGEEFSYDPSYAAIQGPYTAALNDYVRRELGFASDLPYAVLDGLYETWDFSKHANKYLNVAETLRDAMTKNPFLKVFVAGGYFDLATPYFAAAYTFSHLGLDPELAQNISTATYAAGHMMYVHEPSLARLKDDMAAFIRATIPPMPQTPEEEDARQP